MIIYMKMKYIVTSNKNTPTTTANAETAIDTTPTWL